MLILKSKSKINLKQPKFIERLKPSFCSLFSFLIEELFNKNLPNDWKDYFIEFGSPKYLEFTYDHTKNNNTYQFDCKYTIWPSSENIKLEKIPSYSICINGLEILLGKEFIEKNKKMNLIDKLYFLKNNDDVYNIFYNGLLLKLNLKQLLVLILNYLKKNKNV